MLGYLFWIHLNLLDNIHQLEKQVDKDSLYIDTDSVEPITYHFVSAYGDSEPLTLNQFIDIIIHRRYNSSKIDYKIKKGNTTSIGTLYKSLLVKLTPIKLKEYLWEEGQRL